MRPDAISRRALVLTLIAIYLFGVALRCVWLARIGWHTPDLQWLGTPLLTSGDGYWFASGAGNALSGAWADNPRLPLPLDHALVALAWLATRITPWTLDQVILYLPALLGPLAAIPLTLIGRSLGLTRVGLVAGLAVVLLPGLFARTSAGYFDTDPLALTVPLVVVLHLVRLVAEPRHARHALAAALWLAAYPWFYNQGGPLGLALTVTAAVALWLRARGDGQASDGLRHALVLLAASQAPIHPLLRVPLVLLAHFGWRWFDARARAIRLPRAFWTGLAVAVVAVIAWRTGPLVVAKIGYFLGVDGAPQGPVAFGESADFVTETRRQGLVELGDRLAGSLPALILESLAFALACLRYRRLLLFAPVAALGAFAIFGGMRFGIYAAPLLALGLAYALTWLADRLARRLAPFALTALALGALAPAVARDWVMFGRPPVVNAEVQALDALRREAAQKPATTFGWWDDGYPILYFGQTRTLVDGGWRETDVGLAAEILMAPSQRASANLAKLTVAARDAGLPPEWAIAPTLFDNALRDTGLGLAAFLGKLGQPDYRPPPVTSALYLYLPIRLLAILPVIDALRPHDAAPANTPDPNDPGVYRLDAKVEVNGTHIKLGSGALVDVDALTITEAGATRALRTVYSVRGTGPTLEMRKRSRHPEAPTSGIYLHDPGIFIELDERHLASTLIQLLVFENAEPGVVERVYGNGSARIFRILPTP